MPHRRHHKMSMQRHIPINIESSRMYPAEFYDHPFFRSHGHELASFNNSFRDMSLSPYRDTSRDIMPIARDPFRDAITHHTGYHPGQAALPLSRSFFNPERQLTQMDTEMHRMAVEMKKMFENMQHLTPVDANPESWRIKENFLMDNPVVHDQSGGRTFRLQFDVRQFKPEEINVRTSGNQLSVHAKHEEKHDGKSLNREYHRQYELPKDMNPESLVSKLNRDGVLTIEAPLPVTEGPRDRLIQIKHE